MPIQANQPISMTFEVEVPQGAAYTQPYWTRASEYHDAIYTLQRPEFRYMPFAPPEVQGVLTYRVDDVEFTLTRPAQTVSINRPWGEKRRLLSVAPAISLSVSPRIGVIPISESGAASGKTTFTATIEVLNNVKGEAAGTLSLKLPDGWRSSPESAAFRLHTRGCQQDLYFPCICCECRGGQRLHTPSRGYVQWRGIHDGLSGD